MAGSTLDARYFDGRSPQPRDVRLELADGHLCIRGEGVELRLPAQALRWPERQRHGERQLILPDGGLVTHGDGPAWDAWAQAAGRQDGAVVRWMQSWRAVAAALAVTLALVGAGWQWGIPAASRAVAALLPEAATAALGREALAALDRAGLKASSLPDAERARIRVALAAALRADDRPAPRWRLNFRAAGELGIGPNAFALPGGDIVITDELVALLADAPDVLTGVLAHEVGHLQRRHGEASVVQAALLAATAGLLFGDVSSLLAAMPVLVGQMAYSRDAEREADAEARRVLVAAGIDPARMALLFERLAAVREAQDGGLSMLPIALASHPADAERIRYFREGR